MKNLENEYQIEEVQLSKLDIRPFDAAMLKERDEDIFQGRFDSEKYFPAHQFAEADSIVIAAPYWTACFRQF